MLDILDDYFRFLRPHIKYCRLDGSTHYLERQGLMNDFNDPNGETCVFLLSTRAGGVGINLMSADTVVIFDSDWNPHQDSQAVDRAHRIGQVNPVVVYRLITAGSVELKMLARANSKRKLERVVCAKHAFAGTKATTAAKDDAAGDITGEELKMLLSDDFSGHLGGTGELNLDQDMDRVLLDREYLFDAARPRKGAGFEIVEHVASAIVGEVSAAAAAAATATAGGAATTSVGDEAM
jgi:ATP-dependent DNA helicase